MTRMQQIYADNSNAEVMSADGMNLEVVRE